MTPNGPTIDSIPIAFTPPGGWTTWPAPIHVVAAYEDGVHLLRPQGLPDVEVRRHCDGDHLIWDHLGFTARLEHLAPSATDPTDVGAITDGAARHQET